MRKRITERKGRKMAVMTVKCKREFVVSDEKAKEFNAKRRNDKVWEQNKELISQITKQVKMYSHKDDEI